MKKLILVLALSLPLFSFAQRVKFIKNPAVWYYDVAPQKPLDKTWKTNRAIVETTLTPNDDEGDPATTLKQWTKKYLLITQYPYREDKKAPDFTIKLEANTYKIEKMQLDFDYSDKEQPLCELNATARLTVTSKDGQTLLDQQIPFLIDYNDGDSKQVKLSLFFLDPGFKLQFRLTKKAEKRKRLLKKKLDSYQSDVLQYFMMESQKLIEGHFLEQKITCSSAILGIKGRQYKAFSELSKSISKSINRLSSLSKKKRKTLADIKPELEKGMNRWKAELEKASNPKVKQVMYHNMAVVSLLLGDVTKAKEYVKKIPEYKQLKKSWKVSGSYKAYLRGLVDAIKVKKRYTERATLAKY